jgi:hypothetical protein
MSTKQELQEALDSAIDIDKNVEHIINIAEFVLVMATAMKQKKVTVTIHGTDVDEYELLTFSNFENLYKEVNSRNWTSLSAEEYKKL